MSALADDLALNSGVTRATIVETKCVHGWVQTHRSSWQYTGRLKVGLIRRENLPEEPLVDFQLDRKNPLALGGAPSDPRNFVLQPGDEPGDKDRVEACLARAVCAGKITLDEARLRIWHD